MMSVLCSLSVIKWALVMHLPIPALHFHRKLCKLSHTFLQELYRCHTVQCQDWLIHQLRVTDGSFSYQGSQLKSRQTVLELFFVCFYSCYFCWILFIFLFLIFNTQKLIYKIIILQSPNTAFTKANEGFARKTGVVNQAPRILLSGKMK